MRRTLLTIVPAAAVAALGGLTAPLAAAAPAHADKGGVAAPAAPSAAAGAKSPGAAAYKALSGYQVVSASFTDVAGTQTYGDAVCPRGTKVLGGGAVISSTGLEENLNASFPYLDGTNRTWRVYVNNASANDGTFVVYATCAKRVDNYAQVASDAVTVPAGSQASAGAVCPEGTVPLGGGGVGNGSSTAIGLNSSYPNAAGWQVDVNNGTDADDSAVAIVVCGTAPTGYRQVVGRKVALLPQTQGRADADCPANLTVLGGGGYLSTARTTASLNSTLPNSSTQWRSYANLTSTPRAYLTSYAICGKTTSLA